jgi:hypothetical protein
MHPPIISKPVVIRGLQKLGILNSVVTLRHRAHSAARSVRARIGRVRLLRDAGGHEPGMRLVRRNGGWVMAEVRTSPTAHGLMTESLGLAVQFLQRQGIPFFFVPTGEPRSYRLGVEDSHRVTIADGLAHFDWPPSAFIAATPLPRSSISSAARLGRRATARLARANSWALGVAVCDAAGRRVWGPAQACTIEFWTTIDSLTDGDVPPDALRSRLRNPIARVVARPSLTEDHVDIEGLEIPTAPTLARYHRASTFDFPIDVVYTWVDDTDPEWRARRDRFRSQASTALSSDAVAASRYTNRDELRYSLRSLAMYADFVHHVYLVTDQQVPPWLDREIPGLTVVDHREIFRPTDALPVFNSHAIESRLHHIPGLAEHYLYLNDDVFFGRRVHPRTFFHRSGRPHYYPSKALIPAGPARPDEPSVSSAAKNARDLVYAATGYQPTTKMKHTPHPQSRSLLLEIDERFADVITPLGSSRYRSASDVSVAASLHHHYGEAIGAASVGNIVYDYINLARSDLGPLLDRFNPSRFDTFCLNDVEVADVASSAVGEAVRRFLDVTFPFPSPFERSDLQVFSHGDETG